MLIWALGRLAFFEPSSGLEGAGLFGFRCSWMILAVFLGWLCGSSDPIASSNEFVDSASIFDLPSRMIHPPDCMILDSSNPKASDCGSERQAQSSSRWADIAVNRDPLPSQLGLAVPSIFPADNGVQSYLLDAFGCTGENLVGCKLIRTFFVKSGSCAIFDACIIIDAMIAIGLISGIPCLDGIRLVQGLLTARSMAYWIFFALDVFGLLEFYLCYVVVHHL
ncbi:hypothetical protein Nepgr_030892 [Nepenthes gracilis]|uniref:Uncharacterized protein n=1 Tax=Nepenthes gracilis TaxID=150966 RepID=A0AAD3TH20_NEPGR|nr:hypothetical protein Nepgr_030892 [Nepenthes gracilis]